ncbi:MAG TPA: alpha/beta hydrolase [Blastocatellia bacterium]|nr:alpha/beta hydrolase [Blastocatellia bacterium]
MIIETINGPLYFELLGEGSPIVFVSGWAMSCECWRPVVARLEGKHRCFIYDARGVGRSQPASIAARFTVEDHAEDLHAILEDAGVYDAILVGHDVGALVAAQCTKVHPQHFKSLVAVSPRRGLPPEDVKSLAVLTPASLVLRELANYPVIRNLLTRRFRRSPQPHRDRLYYDFANLSPRAAYETALSASEGESAAALQEFVQTTARPSLIICGEKDKKGSAEARRLFAVARAARLATIGNCGFLPMLEYPGQFAKLIEDFAGGDDADRRSLQQRR